MKKIFVPLLLSLFASNVIADAPEKKVLTRTEAIADTDSMIAYIRGTHPDMFAEYPEELFMQKADSIKALIPDSLSVAEFYKYIGILPPLLGDGHTGIWIDAAFTAVQDDPIFPYFVEIDYSDSTFFLPGTTKRVLSINGHDAKDIIEDMLRYSNGESTSFRLLRLEWIFPCLMHILYPATQYHITYVDENSLTDRISHMTVDAELPDKDKINELPSKNGGVPFTYTIEEDISTCVLDFRSFSDEDRFKEFLQDMFHDMEEKGIENLIIDLRNNSGGNSSLGDELFRHISPVPFAQFGNTTVRFSRYLREAYGYDNVPEEDGIHFYPQDESRLMSPYENRFEGNLYLLTSTQTFSSASKFAWAFHYFKMGKIIGRETGGHIVTFGDMIMRRMPNSGITVTCSWKKFYGYGATDDNTHPVRPDYDIAADDALDFTINTLINGPVDIPAN